MFAAECDTGAPLAAALAAGAPLTVDYRPSFVDGIGSRSVFPQMLERARAVVDGSLVSTLEEIGAALRLSAPSRNHVIAEGAGACSIAAALSGRAGGGKVVCVVSGGNIDADKLAGACWMDACLRDAAHALASARCACVALKCGMAGMRINVGRTILALLSGLAA